jgi:TolB protein
MKILAFFLVFLFACQSFSERIKIQVGEAGSKQSKVVFSPFIGSSSIKVSNLESLITRNLEFSSYFKIVPNSMADQLTSGLSESTSKAMYAQGLEFLIAGSTAKKPDGMDVVQFKVYFLKSHKLAFDRVYSGSLEDIGNNFSDDFVQALTGKKSIFNTKFAVTSDRVGNGWKELYLMNWDGSDIQRKSYHKASSLSPSWSPGGNQVVYSSITVQPRSGVRSANLYIYDLRTSRRSMLSSRPGINSGGSFFPDGRSLAMTLTQGGVPDIFRLGLNGSVIDRLTKGPGRAMNVEASISPDGKMMAFSSDRSGKPMLYVMNVNSKKPKRLTFAGRYNSAPSWSPDGQSLVFAGWAEGHFDVFTINIDGTGLKRITQKKRSNGLWSNNESPSYSPDGRFISFISNRTGKKKLYIIRSDGSNIFPVTARDNYNYYHAKWSPFLR